MSGALVLQRGGPLAQQPQHAAPINWNNPLARGLVGAFVPGAGRTFELVTGAQFGTFGARPSLVADPVGLGWQPGSYNLPLSMSPQFGPAQVSVIALVKRTGNYGTYNRVVDVGGDSSSSGGWDIETPSGDSTALQLVSWNGGTPYGSTSIPLPLGVISTLAFSNDGATTRSYLNGAFKGSSGSPMSPATTSGRGPIGIGTDRGGGNAGSAGIIYGVFVFNRVLSDAEIAALSANPWQLFQAPRRRLWLAVNNTAIGAALSGTASAVASATGSLTTNIALAASAAVVASASASLSTQIRLAGSAGAVAASSGALTTQIALAGAAGGAANAAGSLSTQIALAGTAAASSSATGSLTAGTGLSGSASASASAVGSLTTAIRLAGSASCSSSASGDLSTTPVGAALSGAAAASSSASGSLSTAIVLAGTAVAQASASGSLAGQAAALSGSAVSGSSAAGSLSTQIVVAGAAQAVASAVGSLTTAIRLAGAAACSSSATGSLSTGLLPPEPNPHRMIVVPRRLRHFVARRRVRHFEVGR